MSKYLQGTDEEFCLNCGYINTDCQCCPYCSGYPECERDCQNVVQADRESEKEMM